MISCSAGVGRTGTFITIDHVLEQVGKEGVVDIAGVINKIRQQRMKLVQTVVRHQTQTFIKYCTTARVTYCVDKTYLVSCLGDLD